MDSFFGIGIAELFFIAVIALVVLGPERLPGAIREVMKFVRQVRSLTTDLTSQFGDEMKAFDDINPQKILRELTDDPAEQKAAAAKATAAKGAATAKTTPKPAVKPAAKPAPKPVTPNATAKPTTVGTAKPAAKTGIGTANIVPKAGAVKPAVESAVESATVPAGESSDGEGVVAQSAVTDLTGEVATESMGQTSTEPANGVKVAVYDTPPAVVSPAPTAPVEGNAVVAQDATPVEADEPSILPPGRGQAERSELVELNGEAGGSRAEESSVESAQPVVGVKHSAGEGDA